MRGGFWLTSLVVAAGAFRLLAGCGSADGAAGSPATSCPPSALQPSSACVPWPAASVATVTTNDGGVTCTWSDVTELGIDQVFGTTAQPAVVWATASDQVYVATSSAIAGGRPGIAHLDGTRWTREELPTTATVVSLWGAPGGDVWVVAAPSMTSAPTGASRCASPVLRRANGIWRAEPPLDMGSGAVPILTGLDDDHVVVFAPSDTGSRAFRRCGDGWSEVPRRTARPAGVYSVSGATPIDAAHVLAFGGGIDPASRALVAVLDRFDGTSLDAIDIPVALSDIVAISGSSVDDLYVLGLNRNVDGTSRLFHVTEALKTWSPLPVSDRLAMTYLSPPISGTVFGLGCDWPNKYMSPAADCTRFGPVHPQGPFAPEPIDGGAFGVPGHVAADPDHGLHVLASADGGPIATEWRHHRAHCEPAAAP